MNYNNYKNLIFKISWTFKKTYSFLDIDELISISNLTYVRCTKKFNENKNIKFSTFLQTCIENSLKKHLKKEKIRNKFNKNSISFETLKEKKELKNLNINLTYHTNFSFFEMDQNCFDLIKFINQFPEELLTKNKKITKGLLRSIMHTHIKLQHKEIDSIFNQIKESII